jgi:hypothetical protein
MIASDSKSCLEVQTMKLKVLLSFDNINFSTCMQILYIYWMFIFFHK